MDVSAGRSRSWISKAAAANCVPRFLNTMTNVQCDSRFFFFPTTYIKNYRERLRKKKSLSEQLSAIILANLKLLFFTAIIFELSAVNRDKNAALQLIFLWIYTFVCAPATPLIFLEGDKQFLPIDVFLHFKWSLAVDFLNDTSSTLVTCSIINMKSTADIYCIMLTVFSRTIQRKLSDA